MDNDDTDQTVLSVRYIMIPTVTDVAPATVPRGTGQQVIITGSGFHPNATVTFGSGITVTDVQVLDENNVRADITIDTDALAGTRNVQVTNVGSFGPTSGSTNLCLGCFTIT